MDKNIITSEPALAPAAVAESGAMEQQDVVPLTPAEPQRIESWLVTGPGVLTLGTTELPATLSGDMVEIAPKYVGSCGSDIDLIKKGGAHSSHKGTVKPIIPGHEPVGIVTRVGEHVSHIKVGDMVAVEPCLPCEHCEECQDGRYHTCRQTLYMATPPQDGCFARLIQWPAKWCHKLPAGLDPLLAALSEPLAACLQAITRRKVGVPSRRGEEWEAIIGAGAMAMGVIALRKAMSSDNKIMVFARSQADLEFARKIGADLTFQLSCAEDRHTAKKENAAIFAAARDHELVKRRISAAYECTGQGPVLEAAIHSRLVRGEGTYVGLGCHYEIAFDAAMLRRDEASFMPVRRSRDKFAVVMRLLEANPDVFRPLIGSIVKFEDLPMILERRSGKLTGSGGPKVVVEF